MLIGILIKIITNLSENIAVLILNICFFAHFYQPLIGADTCGDLAVWWIQHSVVTGRQGGWTKWDVDEKILDILWQEQRNLVLLWHDYWTHCPMIIGHIVQWLLDTLSNNYWTHCPITIGHIVQWLLDTLPNNYRTYCPKYFCVAF